MKNRARIVVIISNIIVTMALCTACTNTCRRTESVLWGQGVYVGHEDGILEYAFDLSFQEEGSLIFLGRPQLQSAYVVIAPGRIKLSMDGSEEALNYSLDNDTLTLYFSDGYNPYTHTSETRPIAEGEPQAQPPTEPVPVSTLTERGLVERLDEEIFGDKKVITSKNTHLVEELQRMGKGTLTEVVFSPDGQQQAVVTMIGIYLYDSHILAETGFIEAQSFISSVTCSRMGACWPCRVEMAQSS